MHGARDMPFRWASVTKLLTGLALLVAVEEGTGLVAANEPVRVAIVRETDLRVRMTEYMPVGLEFGVLYQN